MGLDRWAMPAAILAAVVVVTASYFGSRHFQDFDAALIGYFVGTVFAVAALVYRYALWLGRPPTRRYFVAGWRSFLSRGNFLAYTGFVPRAIWSDLVGQTFILRRGLARWLAHQAIFWGVLGSLAVTIPLTMGWVRFTLVPPDRYQLWCAGWPVFTFPIEAGTGFALFHALDWTALLLLVGVGLALRRRIANLGQLTTQRFGFDLMPLVLLAAIAVTGLALTASSLWWEGRYYWFISLAHQLIVVGWLISLPFGKFFHIVQRPASIGVRLYQAVDQPASTGEPPAPTAVCKRCEMPMPSEHFATDLVATLADLGQHFDLGEAAGILQGYCPTCKRLLRGKAYYQTMENRFL